MKTLAAVTWFTLSASFCLAAGLPVPNVLVTAEDVQRGKPAPDGYLLAARELGVAATSCVVVEDSPAGVAAGVAAGALVAAVTTTHPADALSSADLVVAGLPEVARALGYSFMGGAAEGAPDSA